MPISPRSSIRSLPAKSNSERAAVLGSSSSQMLWAERLVMPPCMRSIIWLDSCSIDSVWRARTESGSMMRRMMTATQSVKMMPATAITGSRSVIDMAVHTITQMAKMATSTISSSRLRTRCAPLRLRFLSSVSMRASFASRDSRAVHDIGS